MSHLTGKDRKEGWDPHNDWTPRLGKLKVNEQTYTSVPDEEAFEDRFGSLEEYLSTIKGDRNIQ